MSRPSTPPTDGMPGIRAARLAAAFGLGGGQPRVEPIGNGHIHTTLLLTAGERRIVVQSVNTAVFPDPAALAANARVIADHLEAKRADDEYELDIQRPVAAANGELLTRIDDGLWRGFEYFADSIAPERISAGPEAEAVARAFGHFDRALGDLEPNRLVEVIPGFHDLPGRMAALRAATAGDVAGRLASCRAEVEFCLSNTALVEEFAAVREALPMRVCHNDTKVDNVLVSRSTGRAVAVIDVDTAMPGYWMHDFGDLVRTACARTAEDATNLEAVGIREDLFEAVARGYVGQVGQRATAAEKCSLLVGARAIVFMIAVRFLTDFLDGDRYFRTQRPDHNLDRARNQLALYRDISRREGALAAILTRCC